MSSSTSGPTEFTLNSVVDSTVSTDPDELKRVKERQRRKARKQQWRERKKEREALAVNESKEEKEDEDESSSLFDSVIACEQIPVHLIADEALKEEYARRLAVVQQSGGYVSIGTYRKLATLIGDDARVLESCGRDWASEYVKVKHIGVRIVVSDADLPFDEQDSTCDDVMIDE